MSNYSLHLLDSSKETPELNGDKIMLLWTDPPYGTGKVQEQSGIKYKDNANTDYVVNALEKWVPLMHEEGTIAVCCDYRLAHRIVTSMTNSCGWFFRGEVIWEFGLGRPRTSWWPNRHNSILTFTETESSGKFDASAIPRTKRLAPKAGYSGSKPSGSVWDYTMSNTSPERVGYPNQKPLSIITPFVQAHTSVGDLVADPFCGSSSTGVAAVVNGRKYVGCDVNSEAIQVSRSRIESEMEANK